MSKDNNNPWPHAHYKTGEQVLRGDLVGWHQTKVKGKYIGVNPNMNLNIVKRLRRDAMLGWLVKFNKRRGNVEFMLEELELVRRYKKGDFSKEVILNVG